MLWAVRETLKQDSLGQEAAERLRAAGLNACVVYGKGETRMQVYRNARTWNAGTRAKARASYKTQFIWGAHPEIKIISHAHLPLVYGKDARSTGGQDLQQLRQAELLVVDEDPSDVFLLSDDIINQGRNKNAKKYLRLNRPFFESRSDAISVALNTLLAQAASGHLDDQAEVWGRPGQQNYSLTGAAFWRALDEALPLTVDWAAFAEALGRTAFFKYKTGISPWVVSQMRRALRQYRKGGAPSAQYGLTWPEQREDRAALNVRFRFNVSQYRPIPCGVLVLDAYAHPEHYRTAFFPSPTQIHQLGAEPPLKVITAPGAGRNRSAVANEETQEHTLALMEQVVNYARTHGNTLLLCYKDTKPHYQSALNKVIGRNPLPPGVQLELQHWRAGRGSNNWESWNVIALEEFALPSEYMRHALTAVVPEASESGRREREQLWHLHSASENLQMFYRSRQTLAAERGWLREPEVITLYEPHLYDLAGQIRTSVDTTRFTRRPKRTTRPRFAKAVQECGDELFSLFGGIPLLAFTALGLEQRKSLVAEATLEHVRARIRQLVLVSPLPLPLLRGWTETGELAGYEETGRKRRNGREELVEALREVQPFLLEVRDVRPARTPPGINRVQGTVLATSKAAAQATVDTLFSDL
ncbi:hypothetical protein D9600_05190 [Deinococcus sp. DB0503]|nr:hypothetical protein [Deinococcus sp. DB0503]